MTVPYVVLVTGSRYYGSSARVCQALADIEVAHPDCELVMLNGMCDPRLRPASLRRPVRWNVAMKLSPEDQENLLGGDWLSAWAARQRPRWRIELRPADLARLAQGSGLARNDAMIAEALANGAAAGNGECVALTGPCDKPSCPDRGRHISHGTSHCLSQARNAGIPATELPDG